MLLQFFKEMLQLIGGLIFFYFVYIFFYKKNDKPAADRPSMAHTALRELVERAVDEARKLPGLGDTVSTRTQQSTSTTVAEQDYEDLLAAAILNKVIEKYQKDADGNVDNSTRKFLKNKNKMMLDKELEDELANSPENKLRRRICSDPLSLTIEEQIEEITTTYASDEEPECIKNSVLNFSNAKRVPFPEFGMDIVDPSQDSSEEEDDNEDEIDAAHVDHITPVESWEENWLFQKKKIAIKSEPVAMLVPNPSAEYRALIGDKDAEDTSDLSEFSAQSDDEIDEDLIQVINHVRPEESSDTKDSKEETLATVTAHSDGQDGHPPASDKMEPAYNALKETIASNDKDNENLFGDEVIEECVITNGHLEEDIEENYGVKNCLDELVAQVPKTPTSTPARNSLCEYEVTEINRNFCDFDKLNAKLESIDIDDDDDDYDSLIIEHNNEDNNSVENEIEILEIEENTEGKCREAAAKSESKVSETKSLERSEEVQETDLELSAPPRPGTIAEREHKKWENAAPIENNPYSPENINKRLLERQYATRSSDVTGNSNVLPTSQSPPLQILFGNNRPDIKRFGRDYYINESKSLRGDKFHRPGTSNSSRPSSSLSHHSSSIGSDFEQQVSDGLEKLEESSLRRDLHRRTYRGSNISSHFVTNPLIYMDETQSNPNLSTKITTDTSTLTKDSFPKFDDNWPHKSDQALFSEHPASDLVTTNPIYEDEVAIRRSGGFTGDRDSGMYSIESNDNDYSNDCDSSLISIDEELDDVLKLDWDSSRSDEPSYSDGRKYWILNSHKFHTFGGIKRRQSKGEYKNLEAKNYVLCDEQVADFSTLKYQTFGGIKHKLDFQEINISKPPRVRSSIKSIESKFSPLSEEINRESNSEDSDSDSDDKFILAHPLEASTLEGDNLRLEPPLVPKVIDRKFTSLTDLRKLH
ncbi:hypothetical protein KQX54_007472 [Cotesia glomerata]|uniref:Uncharacterized protein n=1 Tax=Cotesia glomerata TaxID=32391 RepID=A0AAV7I182_COTGL|nr:hypothetical protein KQX54_007472 [Cotesia glomerata]